MARSSGDALPARQRLLALGSLVVTAVLSLTVVVFLLRNVLLLAVGVLGLALTVGGGWWFVTERKPRRGWGILGLVLGVCLVGGAVIGTVSRADYALLRIGITVALVVIAVVTARAALLPDLGAIDAELRPDRWRPRHPVLLCNPWSGGGKVEKFGLIEYARELGVETVLLDHGLDLAQLARDAIARGADCLGMAGGDGSQALVASIAIKAGLPFVCVSAGTRNHFALDLGLDREDPRKSMLAFVDAAERRVDYATVGDRLFVNNVSLGIYATVVQQDSYRDAKAETASSLLPEILGRQAEPFDLQFSTPEGAEVGGAFLIMVSNNPYVLGPSVDVSQRDSMDSGRLGIFAVNTQTGAEAAALIALSSLGLRGRDPHWHEFTAESFEVRSHSGTAFAGVDGEALDLPTPMAFRVHPGGLRLLVPESNLAVAERRRSRDINVRLLMSIARGVPPDGRPAVRAGSTSEHLS
ncbi:MAG: diacylglycerol kinase family protein [Actinomycetota bacterium]